MVTNGMILSAWESAENDIDYVNFDRNKQLALDMSSKAFYDVIARRVKLSYQNCMNTHGDVNDWTIATSFRYNNVGNEILGVYSSYQPLSQIISDLISGDSTHSATVNAITGLCMNGGMNWEVDEGKERWIEEYNKYNSLKATKKAMLDMTIYAGSCLLKCVQEEEGTSLEIISNRSFFPVYSFVNHNKAIAYVEYLILDIKDEKGNLKYKDTYYVAIHEKNKITHGFVKKNTDTLEFVEANQEMIDFIGFEGVQLDENNQIIEIVDGWKVYECSLNKPDNKIFGSSHFGEASVTYARDNTVFKTIFGQNMDKVLKPLMILDEGFLTKKNDDSGGYELNTNNGVLVNFGRAGIKPLAEQVDIDLKGTDVNEAIERNKKDMYISLGINETALGMSQKGQYSTEAKRSDMSVTISYAIDYEEAVNRCLCKAVNWIYKQETGQDLNMTIQRADMLTLSEKEKLEVLVMKKDNQLDTHTNLIAIANDISLAEAEEKLRIIQEEVLSSIGEGFNDEDMNEKV